MNLLAFTATTTMTCFLLLLLLLTFPVNSVSQHSRLLRGLKKRSSPRNISTKKSKKKKHYPTSPDNSIDSSEDVLDDIINDDPVDEFMNEIDNDPKDIITCLYLKGEKVNIDEHTGDEFDREDHRCMTFSEYEEDGQSEMVYDLPSHVLSKLDITALNSGISIITIIGAKIHRIRGDPNDIDLLVVRNDARVTVDHFARRHLTLRRRGISSALIIRVTSRDAKNTLSTSDLSDRFFGMDRVSVSSQFYRCSGGMFKFKAASFQDPITNQELTEGGVGNLYYNVDLKGKQMTSGIENDLLILFQEKYGSTDKYDHILFCMPKGMSSDWVGYTYGQTYRSYYNDEWCGYYTLPFHELGHNMGLEHSNENNREYDDRTCMMGRSYRRESSPEQCFNGVKFAQLDWFPQYTTKVDPSVGTWTGRIATFVDVLKLDENIRAPVLLQVGDTFLVYNRAKDHNKGVVGKRDFVTITRGSRSICEECSSEMLGAIHDEKQRIKTLEIYFDTSSVRISFEACRQEVENGIDFMTLSIRREGETSTCNTSSPTKQPTRPPTPNPTRSPTPSPTRPPTPNPTRSPTPSPTRLPTTSPTRSPTPSPTRPPTPNPTRSPTPSPTRLPTTSPTRPPTSNPTRRPTLSPTRSPTSKPTRTPTVNPTRPPSPNPTNIANLRVPVLDVISEIESHTHLTHYACDDSDTEEFYVPSIDQTQKCVWLQARMSFKEEVCSTGLGKLICPETCGLCSDTCEDTSTKFFVGTHRRDCEWVKLRPSIKSDVCFEGSDAALYCPETCNVCDELIGIPSAESILSPPTTLNPTPMPTTLNPTPAPTKYITLEQFNVCDDDHKTKFYVPELDKYERCIWLAARPEYQRMLCEPDHESNAYSICEETCKACTDTCEDTIGKFQVGKATRNCLWLSLRPNMQEELCKKGEDAWDKCPETCNACDIPLAASEIEESARVCDDSKVKFFFVEDINKYQKCVWLAARPERKATLCAKNNNSGARYICPETCGICVDNCEDSRQKITIMGQRRDCLWLSLRPGIHDEQCKIDAISAACPETCDICDR